jgi:hypothetical protein
MLTPDLRHKHSWLAWDWEKIKYSDLEWAPTSSWWWNNYQTTVQQSISTAWTTITITPNFNINKVKIIAFNNWNPWAKCDTLYTASNNQAIWVMESYSYNWSYIVPTFSDYNSTSWVLRLDNYNNSTQNIRARIENITVTSFDINFYEVEYTWYVTVILECYW